MMQYTGKYWMVLAPLIRRSLTRHFNKSFAVKTMKQAKIVYRKLLSRTADIGADNPMASNIYMCFVFFAVWQTADGQITVDMLRTISHEVIGVWYLKCMGIFMNMNRPSCVRAMDKMMHQNAVWLEKHPQYKDISWDFNFDESKHRDGFYYHFTKCPLYEFAKKEGFMDVLPVMCEMDHLTAKLMHATLHRKHTLASGGKVCDYWFVGDRLKNPK